MFMRLALAAVFAVAACTVETEVTVEVEITASPTPTSRLARNAVDTGVWIRELRGLSDWMDRDAAGPAALCRRRRYRLFLMSTCRRASISMSSTTSGGANVFRRL